MPSTALMCIIPASWLSQGDYSLLSKIKPETIVAADIAGADKIFKIGGTGNNAMAYGTEQVLKLIRL